MGNLALKGVQTYEKAPAAALHRFPYHNRPRSLAKALDDDERRTGVRSAVIEI